MLKLFTLAQVQAYSLWQQTKNEEGQTMAEYAIVLAVITVGVLLALQFLNGGIVRGISKVGSILP